MEKKGLLALFNILNFFNNINFYKLNTSFSFDEPVEIIWNEIIDFENWPSWWVGLDRIENLNKSESVEGNTYKSVINGYIPYSLSFYSFIKKVVPMSMISTKVNGDLEGDGVCSFSVKENTTYLNFKWNVRPTKLWMKILSPIAKIYFIKNHDKILKNGLKGLLESLKKKKVV